MFQLLLLFLTLLGTLFGFVYVLTLTPESSILSNNLPIKFLFGFSITTSTSFGFGLIATGVQDFTQNLPPEITIIDAPGEGENYTDNFSISLNVFDRENDGYVLAVEW